MRILGDLVGDQGIRQTTQQMLTNPVIQAVLDDAAGMINMAASWGQKYTAAELGALTGVGQAILFRLEADLAFWYLVIRRGLALPDLQKQQLDSALALLEQIKSGQRVFDVPGDVAAGTPNILFPSFYTYRSVNQVRDHASRFFPVRRPQVPASD